MDIKFLRAFLAPCWALLFLLTAPGNAASLTTYTNSGTFTGGVAGLTFLGTENFESSTLAAGSIDYLSDPLAPGVANSYFPHGTNPAMGLTVQANLQPSGATPNPAGANGLATASVGFYGTPSDQISSNANNSSFDLIFSPGVKAVGLAPLFFDNSATSATDIKGTIEYRVFDPANGLLGEGTITGVDYSQSAFLGFVMNGANEIGRINLYAGNVDANGLGLFAGADDISAYAAAPVPEPESYAMLLAGLGLLGFFARSRKQQAA